MTMNTSEDLSSIEDDDVQPYVPPSRWPLVVGTLATLYACLGLMVMCVWFLGVYLGPWVQASVAGMEPIPVPLIILIGQTIFSVVGIALGILLLIGGISTLKRLRRGPKFINYWVVLRLVLALYFLVFTFFTIDVNIAYQEQVREAAIELMEQKNYSEEQIAEMLPDLTPKEMRSAVLTWNVAIAVMSAVCPIVLGLILSSRRIRKEAKEWP